MYLANWYLHSQTSPSRLPLQRTTQQPWVASALWYATCKCHVSTRLAVRTSDASQETCSTSSSRAIERVVFLARVRNNGLSQRERPPHRGWNVDKNVSTISLTCMPELTHQKSQWSLRSASETLLHRLSVSQVHFELH